MNHRLSQPRFTGGLLTWLLQNSRIPALSGGSTRGIRRLLIINAK